ncbi:hypothetical protein KCTC52924_03587 [Arenibacter antarcticus]|uniref:Uncharacterized protein n=1 Tax=Arenibacter antarcticus TaxID=2040469 RepID=A0ABW5VHJ5_9FLAO|nr:hypothetical protein [Arenibacter sp. H213]MCM4169809.1 hypothetical protein [Arenibacter sp. H213]
MEENLKVDKDYKEAFNLGYELAKDLNLKSPMFKNIELGNSRMHTMQTGMAEYNREITQENVKDKTLGEQRNEFINKEMNSRKSKGKDKGAGFDYSI